MPQCSVSAVIWGFFFMNNQNPIGILDSGVGGLSVFKELFKEMPYESYVYFADSAYCPYGAKPKEELEQRIDKIVSFLIRVHRCKLIVFACNTATAVAIESIRARYTIPFIGMEPAVKPAALHSHTRAVGILATAGTLKGKLFLETAARFASDTHLEIRVGSGLVELVEAGLEDSQQTEVLLREYLAPMVDARVDHIVLGCTHYPFLTEQIRKIVGTEIVILNPAPAVAKHTREVLQQQNALSQDKKPEYVWFTSGEVSQFEHFYQLQMQKGELPALPLTIIHTVL